MYVDGAVVAGLPQQRHDPLGLTKRIGADEMRPLGEERARGQQLIDFQIGTGMAKDGKAEGRLRYEDIAGHDFEGRAGRVGLAFVVA